MARSQQVVVTLTDDIDGLHKGIETVSFSIDGQTFEIDLGPKNAKALRADVAKWSAHARKGKKTTRPRRSATVKPASEAAAIRKWAVASGIEVPARGRIPKALAEQYHAA